MKIKKYSGIVYLLINLALFLWALFKLEIIK